VSNERLGWLLVIPVAGAMLLSACTGGNEGTVQHTPPSVTQSPTAVMTPTSVPPTATPVPHTPKPASEVPWLEAEEMILNGEVQQVTQLHSLEVTLYLWDGREVVTMEPKIDEVFRVIERCGEPCSDIVMATE
jgi:hypothetical protein